MASRSGSDQLRPTAPSRTDAQPASIYLELRRALIQRDAADFGITSTAALPNVWAALVDVGFDTGSATLMAAADGATSLYLSNGGATLGGGGVPEIATASQNLLGMIEGWLSSFVPATEFPLPAPGRVCFIVLTYDGPRTAEAGMAELESGTHPLTPVFRMSEIVLGGMTRLQAAADAAGSTQAGAPTG